MVLGHMEATAGALQMRSRGRCGVAGELRERCAGSDTLVVGRRVALGVGAGKPGNGAGGFYYFCHWPPARVLREAHVVLNEGSGRPGAG